MSRVLAFALFAWLVDGPTAVAANYEHQGSQSDLSLSAVVNTSDTMRPLIGVALKQELGDALSVRLGGEVDMVATSASRLNVGLLTNGPVYCGLGLNYVPGGSPALNASPLWGDVLAGGRIAFLTGAVGAEYRHGLLGTSSLALTFGGPI